MNEIKNEYRCVTDPAEVKAYLGDSKIVSFDYETAPDEGYRNEDKAALDAAKSHICTLSLSVREHTGIMIPVAHKVGPNMPKAEFVTFRRCVPPSAPLIPLLARIPSVRIRQQIADKRRFWRFALCKMIVGKWDTHCLQNLQQFIHCEYTSRFPVPAVQCRTALPMRYAVLPPHGHRHAWHDHVPTDGQADNGYGNTR